MGVLSADPDADELHAIVTHSGKSIYVPRVEVQNGVLSSTSDSIILDRPIARPGETLFVKGKRKILGIHISSFCSRVHHAE